jgi:cytochrome c55X
MSRREVFAIFTAAITAAPTFAGGTISSERASELERLVRHDCGSCHGMTLKGGLGPDIRQQSLAGRSIRSIANTILDGVPGTPMPPWRPLLSEAEAQWIADYLLKGGDQ